MIENIRLAGNLTFESVVDGPGIRTVIWTQGCPHNCKECHNPETHDFNSGQLVKIKDVINVVLAEGKDVTFSGGDPFVQPEACTIIAREISKHGLHSWSFSGWTFEQLLERAKNEPAVMDFLESIDRLVDGPFILEQKNLLLPFRGSNNQRIINVPESLKSGRTVVDYTYEELNTNTRPEGIFI